MNTQYDTLARNLLARRSVLSHILAETVEDFKDVPPEEIENLIDGEIYIGNVPVDAGLTNKLGAECGDRVVGLNTVQAEQFEGIAVFDIVFYVRIGDEHSKIIINIEAQKDEPSGYDVLNRAIFYVSRLVSSQKERDFTGKNFNDLSRVYSIWICMNMDECIWNHVHLTNDAVMANHNWKGKLDMLNIVLLGLPKELPPQDDEHRLHRMLSALFTLGLTSNERIEILENEYSIPAVSEFREELNTMCNLSQGIYEQGEKNGIQQGEARGEMRGLEKGKKEQAKASALYLHSIGLSIDTIAKAVSETPEQVKEWLLESLS